MRILPDGFGKFLNTLIVLAAIGVLAIFGLIVYLGYLLFTWIL